VKNELSELSWQILEICKLRNFTNYKFFKNWFILHIGLGYTEVTKIRYFADYEFLKNMLTMENIK